MALCPALTILADAQARFDTPNYYVLNLPAPVLSKANEAPALGPLAVRQFDAPAFPASGPIAYRKSTAQLGFYDYHRWATDPRHVVSLAVIHALQARGVFRSVGLFDGHGSRSGW
ncbi:MAG: ABC-type transport auxiliary lipoprotein family protein [Ignavibacteriota bacterium]